MTILRLSSLCIALWISNGALLAQQPMAAAPAANTTGEHQFLVHSFCKDKPAALETGTTTIVFGGQEIRDFSLANADAWRLRYALLVDTSGSTRVAAKFINESATKLTRVLQAEKGDGFLALFSEKFFYDDQYIEPERVTRLIEGTKFAGKSALYDALIAAIELLPKRFPAVEKQRYAVFVITDADDNRSSATLQMVTDEARKRHVAIYPIVLKMLSGPDQLDRARKALLQGAAATGGVGIALSEPKDIGKILGEYLRTQQVLTLPRDIDVLGINIRSSKCKDLSPNLLSAVSVDQ